VKENLDKSISGKKCKKNFLINGESEKLKFYKILIGS
jgi:hypothetical protein